MWILSSVTYSLIEKVFLESNIGKKKSNHIMYITGENNISLSTTVHNKMISLSFGQWVVLAFIITGKYVVVYTCTVVLSILFGQ